MNNSKTRLVAIAATAGTIAMLSAAVAQATVICAFSCKTSSSVPEPATLGLLALGLAGAAIARRRK
jgi:hypothetical protein